MARLILECQVHVESVFKVEACLVFAIFKDCFKKRLGVPPSLQVLFLASFLNDLAADFAFS